MSVRNDLTVDWEASPRIITIASPSTVIVIQDLHDTLTTIEESVAGMSQDKLLDSAGKEDLGGGTFVGVTAKLQNARLAFEARGGPGYTYCKVFDGNLVAIDANGDAIEPIETTAFVQVQLIQSVAAAIKSQSIAETTASVMNSLNANYTTSGSLSDTTRKAKQNAQLAFINSL